MRSKPERIESVGIGDLVVAYASQTEARCDFTHRDGYVQPVCSLKVYGMRRTKSGKEHLLDIEYFGDVNRPGEDAGNDCHWSRAKVRYNEFQRIGVVYYSRRRKGGQR